MFTGVSDGHAQPILLPCEAYAQAALAVAGGAEEQFFSAIVHLCVLHVRDKGGRP